MIKIADVSLDWPADGTFQGDIGVGPDGDILACDGDVETRQRVVRRWLTNQRLQLDDGSVLAPDDRFNPTLGKGLRRGVGQAVTPARVEETKQLCRDGMMEEEAIAVSPPPDAFLQSPAPGVLSAFGVFTTNQSQRPVATPRITLS